MHLKSIYIQSKITIEKQKNHDILIIKHIDNNVYVVYMK